MILKLLVQNLGHFRFQVSAPSFPDLENFLQETLAAQIFCKKTILNGIQASVCEKWILSLKKDTV